MTFRKPSKVGQGRTNSAGHLDAWLWWREGSLEVRVFGFVFFLSGALTWQFRRHQTTKMEIQPLWILNYWWVEGFALDLLLISGRWNSPFRPGFVAGFFSVVLCPCFGYCLLTHLYDSICILYVSIWLHVCVCLKFRSIYLQGCANLKNR